MPVDERAITSPPQVCPAALLLGSWWGVIMSPLFALLFAIPLRIEERALLAGLPDYADYATRVRYRLVPGLW